MPPTVSVAAFVFGIVLLLAALIGKELKLVTVELPALGPGRRIIIGSLGLALTLFGLMDGRLLAIRRPARPLEAPSTALLASAGPGAAAAPLATLPPVAAGVRAQQVEP